MFDEVEQIQLRLYNWMGLKKGLQGEAVGAFTPEVHPSVMMCVCLCVCSMYDYYQECCRYAWMECSVPDYAIELHSLHRWKHHNRSCKPIEVLLFWSFLLMNHIEQYLGGFPVLAMYSWHRSPPQAMDKYWGVHDKHANFSRYSHQLPFPSLRNYIQQRVHILLKSLASFVISNMQSSSKLHPSVLQVEYSIWVYLLSWHLSIIGMEWSQHIVSTIPPNVVDLTCRYGGTDSIVSMTTDAHWPPFLSMISAQAWVFSDWGCDPCIHNNLSTIITD